MKTQVIKTFTFITLLICLGVTSFAQRDFYIKQKDGTVAKSSKEKRVALVIGNNSYQYASGLENPINDATDMKNALHNLGFQVVYLQNGKRADIINKIREFRKLIEGKNTSALFFYAGHGLQLNDDNWLVPIDAKPETASDVEVSCISLNYLMRNLEEANSGVNIVILDACRNNPFKYAGRSSTGGLTQPQRTPSGTFIAFSTAPSQVASDGSGRNSPYTAALLKVLPQPNITIEKAFKKVRTELKNKHGQISWENSSLLGDFYFNPTGGNVETTTTTTTDKDPNLDSDGDGLMDNVDKCPYVAGLVENSGCPEANVTNDSKDPFANQMVTIKGGTFEMGNERGQGDTQPVHTVTLNDFKMSKYEVTQAQWRKIMRHNPSLFIGCDECPVERVTWYEAKVFIEELNKITGKKYRLPTEAEWEYAARGGQKSHAYKYAGSDDINKVAWHLANNDNKKTHPVGLKQPNELGIYDLSGNVYEWCNDFYNKTYYNSSGENNPQGSKTGKYRVIRGGAYSNQISRCEVTYRNFIILPKHKTVGFRLVSDL